MGMANWGAMSGWTRADKCASTTRKRCANRCVMFGTCRATDVAVVILMMAIGVSAQEPAPKISREDVISIQIGLDDAGFSCGQIDGKWGGMTRQALTAWQQANGLKATGEFDAITAANFPAGEANYTNYVVTAADVAKLTPIPEDWKARSQLTQHVVRDRAADGRGEMPCVGGIDQDAESRDYELGGRGGGSVGDDVESCADEARAGGESAGKFVGKNDLGV